MCGGYRLGSDLDSIAAHFSAAGEQLQLPGSGEVFPGGRAPLIALRRRDGRPERRIGVARWGLPMAGVAADLSSTSPVKSGQGETGRLLHNARLETLHLRPSFRESLQRRRCLVPVCHFFEWSGERGARRRWRVAAADGRPMALAGLWCPSEEGLEGAGVRFTIVTTESCGALASLHHRMPLWLRDERALARWLSGPPTQPGRWSESGGAGEQVQDLRIEEDAGVSGTVV